jgi:hypothetical protein
MSAMLLIYILQKYDLNKSYTYFKDLLQERYFSLNFYTDIRLQQNKFQTFCNIPTEHSM